MLYALERNDGVTITTMLPVGLKLHDGTEMTVVGISEQVLLVLDPAELGVMYNVDFEGDIRELDIDSVPHVGELVFSSIEAEIAKMPRPGDIISSHPIALTDLPGDMTFRDAWIFEAGVQVSLERARELHKDRMRAVRAPLLAALDVEYQRADEEGDDARKASVVARKNALRDVTSDPAIASAASPDVLKTIWPSILPSLIL